MKIITTSTRYEPCVVPLPSLSLFLASYEGLCDGVDPSDSEYRVPELFPVGHIAAEIHVSLILFIDVQV
jgi:hypothetical protein